MCIKIHIEIQGLKFYSPILHLRNILTFTELKKNEVDTNPTLSMENPRDHVINLAGVTSHWLGNAAFLFSGWYLNLNLWLLTDSACGIITGGVLRANPRPPLLPEIQLTSCPSTHPIFACLMLKSYYLLELIHKWMASSVLSGSFQSLPPKSIWNDPNQETRGLSRWRNPQWTSAPPTA